MFTSKTSPTKLQTIRKRALRFAMNDYELNYVDLIKQYNVPGLKILTL